MTTETQRSVADVLIEDQIAKYDEKIEKEVAKAAKRFGDSFDEAKYRATSANVLEHVAKRDALHERYKKAMNDGNLDELKQIIIDEEIVCPISGTRNWTEVRQFNLMFATQMGSVAEGADTITINFVGPDSESDVAQQVQQFTSALNAKGYHPAVITDQEKCIACAMCATMCPDCEIKVEKDA